MKNQYPAPEVLRMLEPRWAMRPVATTSMVLSRPILGGMMASGPEPSAGCCVSVASFALSSGFVVPYAQMIVCDVLEALW